MLAEAICNYCSTGWDRHDLTGRRIVAFTGSREKHWYDMAIPTSLVEQSITRLLWRYGDANLFVKVGDANGVDALVREACAYFGVCHEVLTAHWTVNGKKNPFAGHERNGRVLYGADQLIAISRPGRTPTPGTGNAMMQARQMGIPIFEWRGKWLSPEERSRSLSMPG